jgi:hypothetical protein
MVKQWLEKSIIAPVVTKEWFLRGSGKGLRFRPKFDCPKYLHAKRAAKSLVAGQHAKQRQPLSQSPTSLLIVSALSRRLYFFPFVLNLWIRLWLAETRQQPISQTTWLKVTPHCNHCDHSLSF